MKLKKKGVSVTRTRNLLIMSQTRYPLCYRDSRVLGVIIMFLILIDVDHHFVIFGTRFTGRGPTLVFRVYLFLLTTNRHVIASVQSHLELFSTNLNRNNSIVYLG